LQFATTIPRPRHLSAFSPTASAGQIFTLRALIPPPGPVCLAALAEHTDVLPLSVSLGRRPPDPPDFLPRNVARTFPLHPLRTMSESPKNAFVIALDTPPQGFLLTSVPFNPSRANTTTFFSDFQPSEKGLNEYSFADPSDSAATAAQPHFPLSPVQFLLRTLQFPSSQHAFFPRSWSGTNWPVRRALESAADSPSHRCRAVPRAEIMT